MKKLAILLSLVMVLGLSVSAFAGVSGSVEYGFEKVGDTDMVWDTTFELSFDGVVDGATANIELSTVDAVTSLDDPDTPEDEFATEPTLVVDNAWVEYSNENCPVDVTFGDWSWHYKAVEGVMAKYAFDSVTLEGLYEPAKTDDAFGFYGKYSTSFDAVDVVADVLYFAGDSKVTGKGTYNLDDVTSFYGKAIKDGDADVDFEAGAETAVAGVTLTVDWTKSAETVELGAEKAFDGITFSAGYTIDNTAGADNTLEAAATVEF